MPFRSTDIARLLEHKFHFEAKENDHLFFYRAFPGDVRIRTKVSHGNKSIGRKLESLMARQVRVPKDMFQGMFRCTVRNEDYEDHIAKRQRSP